MQDERIIDYKMDSFQKSLDGIQNQINSITSSDRKQQEKILAIENDIKNQGEKLSTINGIVNKITWLIVSTVIIALLALVVGPQIF